MPVICNQRHRCKMADECGGAEPHEPCSECGNGPMCKTLSAKCEESPAPGSDNRKRAQGASVNLSKEQKQAIADGFRATLEHNSIASRIDPGKLFSVEPMGDVCSQKQRKHDKYLTPQKKMPETHDN